MNRIHNISCPAGNHIRSLSILAVVLLLTCALSAQTYRGSIRGTVTDPSGAVVPNAKVTAKNQATGLAREVTTNGEGSYVLAELPSGNYEVAAESQGFQRTVRIATVSVGLDTAVDITLHLGGDVIVNVSAAPPIIETTRDVLGEVVEQTLVNELPLNGRDFGKLVALVPGATVEPSGVAAIQSGFGQFSINGNRDRSNNYTLDGTDNNDPFFNNSALNQTGIGGAPASLLPIDAIQEFNLQSQFAAEYGRNSGSVVNIITKSGTNQLHGSAFEFLRNDYFDARNYFNRKPVKQGVFRNNNFGASLGGPIVKDKTFFFGAYEGQRERVTSDSTFFVPTPTELQASQVLADANGPTVGFTHSLALTSILGFFPASTGFNGSTGTLAGSVKDKNEVDSFIAKVEHNISSNQQIAGRYAFARSQQVFPLGGLGFGAASRFSQFAQSSPTRVQLLSFSLLSTLSGSKINEVRFGYSRYRTSFSAADAKFDPKSIGIDFGSGKLSLPEIDFSGVFDNLGASAFSIPRGRTSQSFQVLDNFSWIRGRHTVKFGGEYRRATIDNFNDNLERGQLQFGPSSFGPAFGSICPFTGTQTANCTDPAITTLANFYLGNTNSFPLANGGNTQRTTFNNGLSFFGQDDFRLSSRLTLNLGMRWEYFGPIGEKHNLLFNLGQDGQLAQVGTDGLKRAYNRDFNNFAPRFGFAWNPRNGTVVRGSYGLYYDYIPQDLLIASFTNDAGLATAPIGPSPVVFQNFNQGAFNGSTPGPVFTPSLPACPGCSIFITPRNLVTPYVQGWNLNVEQPLTSGIALQTGYVGSKGTKLVRLLDVNQADWNGNRPNANFSAMDEFATVSASTYHAMQATIRVKAFHGLSGFTGYTWSKSLDDASDGIDFNFATVAFPQNSLNLHAEHGPSNFDTRHRFTAAFTYALPHWGGPKLLTGGWQLNTIITAQSGRPVPIVSAKDTSGSTDSNNLFATPANFHQRPNLVPGQPIINSNWASAPDTIGYLNAKAFSQPAFATTPVGSFGNLGRNAIYGPKFWNVDFALNKDFRLLDRLNLQLRAELFNIFNHPNFALPNFFVNPGSGPSGLISSTPDVAQTNPGLGGGGPRVIQLGLKLKF